MKQHFFLIIGGVVTAFILLGGVTVFNTHSVSQIKIPAMGKVVTTDLCADQWGVALLPPDTLAGVSPQGADATLSAVAEQVSELPAFDASAEALLASGATVILRSGYDTSRTQSVLQTVGIASVNIPYTENVEDIPAVFQKIAQDLSAAGVVQKQEKIQLLTEHYKHFLDLFPMPLSSENHPVALYLRPDGGTVGQGSFADQMLHRAGYRNMATRYGISGWGRIDLETVVLDPPPLLITSFFGLYEAKSRQTLAHHPVLQKIVSETPRINVPGSLWVCNSWVAMWAVPHLAAHPSFSQSESSSYVF